MCYRKPKAATTVLRTCLELLRDESMELLFQFNGISTLFMYVQLFTVVSMEQKGTV